MASASGRKRSSFVVRVGRGAGTGQVEKLDVAARATRAVSPDACVTADDSSPRIIGRFGARTERGSTPYLLAVDYNSSTASSRARQ